MRLIVRTGSGLGNQLFQYAAGLYYADRYRAQLEIAVDPNKAPESHGYPRPFQLTKFRISAPTRTPSAIEQIVQAANARTQSIARIVRGVTGAALVSDTNPYHFAPDLPIRTGTKIVHLRGYWQSARYAEPVAQKVRSELTLNESAAGMNREIVTQIERSACPISLHVRRGDYTLASQGSLALPLSYYHHAIDLIRKMGNDPTFFVFSDDIDFARKNLPTDIRSVFVDHNDAHTAYEDLRLMSTCHHHIIANSSFSWWGAWLNARPDKRVIAPKYWFGTADSYYADLFPTDWTLIDNVPNQTD